MLVTLQIRKLKKINQHIYTALIDRQNQFNIYSFLNLYSGFPSNSVDPDQPASSEDGKQFRS